MIIIIAYEINESERAKENKFSNNWKFLWSIFSSKMVEIVWKCYHIWTSPNLITCKYVNMFEWFSKKKLPKKK